MDLLITIIGNAAVDPGFRQRLLNDPLRTADEYGFHLTKGEVEMLERVFTKQAPRNTRLVLILRALLHTLNLDRRLSWTC